VKFAAFEFCGRSGVIDDKLSAAGWSWGYCSAVAPNTWRAHREGRRRYIVRSDELLSAFLELEATLLRVRV
jgi:predicted type IV restriction endonuclease